ncbi:hypothetical protein [Clostridium sp. Marseille-Q2269]|uniref:hypothetical protein n=1 Tax=Clostridium sp. Marseille-Q2269 TaxID=2942205 RepID=UPI002072C250|nr:hypothetical protein [Clostridium sp. Marseille-Q2269]
MAYTRTNWVDGFTPLNSDNLNNIEAGIAKVDNSLLNIYTKNDWKVYKKDGFTFLEFPNGIQRITGIVDSVVGRGYAAIALQNYFKEIFDIDPQIKYGEGGSEENKVVIGSVQISPVSNTNIYIRLLTGDVPQQPRKIYFQAWGIKK